MSANQSSIDPNNTQLTPEDFRRIGTDEKQAEVIQRQSVSAMRDAWERLLKK